MTRLLTLLLALSASACSMAKMTGNMMNDYTINHLTPYTLGSSDPGMACEIAQSTGNLLLSYARVTDSPDKASVTTMASAGACAEQGVYEAELRGLRALKRGDASEAQDARFAEQRSHAVAAQRYYRAWQSLQKAFPGHANTCPTFEEDDVNSEEIAWLVGHLAGAQAVQHDRATKGLVGVPTDLPQQVARGVRCLNNERWWGVPAALQAAIWTGVPGSAPAGTDAWAELDKAATVGAKSGIRLAVAIAAQAAEAGGKEAEMRKYIKAFVAAGIAVPAPARWQMLDLQGGINILQMSDRAWTRAEGHRTPTGELGSFPGEGATQEDGPSIFDE